MGASEAAMGMLEMRKRAISNGATVLFTGWMKVRARNKRGKRKDSPRETSFDVNGLLNPPELEQSWSGSE